MSRENSRPLQQVVARATDESKKGSAVSERVKRFWNKGEVRLNDDKSVDEVVASGVDVHIEQMSDEHWWMSIGGKQGRRMVLNFYRDGKNITLTVEDDGFHSSGVSAGFKD